MSRSSARWGLGAAAVVAALLAAPNAAPLILVGGAVVAVLIAVANRTRPAGVGRGHLVFTTGTSVAFFVGMVAFQAQSLGGGLGAFACGVLATVGGLDLAIAVFGTRRVAVTASADRTEVVAGDPLTLAVTIDGPRLPVLVRLGSGAFMAAEPAASGPVGLSLSRGVLIALPLEVRSTGVCGVLGFVRQRPVVLPRPVYAGPRPVTPERPFPELAGRVGDQGQLPALIGDVVRGVRDYVPGDRRSQVHWRASARVGRLVVKEVEETVGPLLVLVLDMGSGDAAGERAAARAAWYLNEALHRGAEIVLLTREATGPRRDRVDSTAEVIRRLASAVSGPPVPGAVPAWVTATSGSTTPSGASTVGGQAATPPLASWAAPEPLAPPGQRVLRVSPDGDTWD